MLELSPLDVQDQKGATQLAEQRGMEKGIAKGIAKGMDTGMAKKAQEMVIQAHGYGMKSKDIAKMFDLDLGEVERMIGGKD